MTDKQPEALFLAAEIEAPLGTVVSCELDRRAAAELRRLHEANRELVKALQLCEGNISSLLAANHPMVYGVWLDVVRAAIAKAGGEA
jgi:hypothetical protein